MVVAVAPALLARCELDKHGSGLRVHILAINHLVDQFAARANQPTNQPSHPQLVWNHNTRARCHTYRASEAPRFGRTME